MPVAYLKIKATNIPARVYDNNGRTRLSLFFIADAVKHTFLCPVNKSFDLVINCV